jgi:hypothetical protein
MKTKSRSILVAGIALAGLALSTLALVTCDSTNVLAMITTEVKKANNKLLVVTGLVSPAGTENVNPGISITLEFDRPVDTNTITASTLTVTPADGSAVDYALAISFSNGNKTVTLEPNPFLKDNTSYDIVLSKDVLAEDGSELEKAVSWSFKTGVYPAGNLLITDASGNDIAYTKDRSALHLKIIYKTVADKYRIGNAITDFSNFTDPDAGWRPTSDFLSGSVYTTPSSSLDSKYFEMPAGDGAKTIYIQFQRSSTGDISTIRSDTIILDTVKPVISVSTPTIYHGPAGAPTASITASDDRSGVDAASYAWANVTNTTVTPANSTTPTISVSGGDASYAVTVTVKDIAGNISDPGTVTVIKDLTPPNLAPGFTVTPATPAFAMTPAPRWDWQPLSVSGYETLPGRIYKYELRDSDNILYYSRDPTAALYFRLSAPKWPDYSRRLQPGTYTLKVWERDNAGNYSAPATSLPLVVTSILPEHGSLGLTIPVTLQWWTIANPADPTRYPYPRGGYVLHWGALDKNGILIEQRPRDVPLVEGADPSEQLSELDLKTGTSYGWYVVVPEWKDLRVPALESSDPFWTFTTR